MAKNLGKSQQFVRDIMKKYQINVPTEIKEYFIQNSRFKKGNESFNKGKKLEDYLAECKIEKIKETSFKKGNKPHNTKPEGHQSIRTDKRGISYIFTAQDCIDFHDYWTETDANGKMRFTREITWNTDKRMLRWKKNDRTQINGQKTSTKTTKEDVMNGGKDLLLKYAELERQKMGNK